MSASRKSAKRQRAPGPTHNNFANTFARNQIGAITRGPERKNVDVQSTLTPTAASNQFAGPVLLNGLAQGDTANQRAGRQVTLKSLLLRYSWEMGAGSSGGSPARILIVYDRQTNGSAHGITDLLSLDQFNSPLNLSNKDRFLVLADVLTSPISIVGDVSVADVIIRKFKQLNTMFNTGSTGAVADITTGSIYLWVAQTNDIGATAPVFTFYNRIRYTDA